MSPVREVLVYEALGLLEKDLLGEQMLYFLFVRVASEIIGVSGDGLCS